MKRTTNKHTASDLRPREYLFVVPQRERGSTYFSRMAAFYYLFAVVPVLLLGKNVGGQKSSGFARIPTNFRRDVIKALEPVLLPGGVFIALSTLNPNMTAEEREHDISDLVGQVIAHEMQGGKEVRRKRDLIGTTPAPGEPPVTNKPDPSNPDPLKPSLGSTLLNTTIDANKPASSNNSSGNKPSSFIADKPALPSDAGEKPSAGGIQKPAKNTTGNNDLSHFKPEPPKTLAGIRPLTTVMIPVSVYVSDQSSDGKSARAIIGKESFRTVAKLKIANGMKKIFQTLRTATAARKAGRPGVEFDETFKNMASMEAFYVPKGILIPISGISGGSAVAGLGGIRPLSTLRIPAGIFIPSRPKELPDLPPSDITIQFPNQPPPPQSKRPYTSIRQDMVVFADTFSKNA